MLDPTSKSNTEKSNTVNAHRHPSVEPLSATAPLRSQVAQQRRSFLAARRKGLRKARRSQHPVLKTFDSQYWQRLLRYLYVRFLRIQSSPEAIARGAAAGIFSGAFPLIGLQSVFGIAIAALIRGNKMIAVAGTFVSNPFTSIPIFAFNFYLGRWILGVETAALPSSMTDINAWLSMGADVFIAMMLGSLIVGAIGGALGYYLALMVAQRVDTLKKAKQRNKEAKRRQSEYRVQE